MLPIDDEKLEKLLSLLQITVSFEPSSLDDLNLNIHQDFLIKVLEKPQLYMYCHDYPEHVDLVSFFKWVWSHHSLHLTTPVLELLVFKIYSNIRLSWEEDIYSLWNLVKEIGEKQSGLLNVDILNKLIITFSYMDSYRDKGAEAAILEVFEKFEVFQLVPTAETYYLTIQHLSSELACSVCQKMLDAKRFPNGEKMGRILSWFCKDGKFKEAHAVYMAEIENQRYPHLSCVNFLVAKLCDTDETVQLALEVLNDIRVKTRKLGMKTFLGVVRALCRINDVDAAKKLVLKMIAHGPPPGNAVFNVVITGYSKAGEMGQAKEMLRLLKKRRKAARRKERKWFMCASLGLPLELSRKRIKAQSDIYNSFSLGYNLRAKNYL